MRDDIDWYREGIQPEEVLDGWAVFSEAEGDAPCFRGFFVMESDAHAFASALDPSPHAEDDEKICVDGHAVPAVWRDGVVYCSNDYALDTQELLRERLDALLSPPQENADGAG